VAATIGFPVIVRPRTCWAAGRCDCLRRGQSRSLHEQRGGRLPGRPILIDRFLEDAFELDVDAVADGTGAVVIGGIMEHIEEAGIHSGDSSCVVRLPGARAAPATIRDYSRRIARR